MSALDHSALLLTFFSGKLNLSGIDYAGIIPEYWGPNPHETKKEWVDEVDTQCKDQGVSISEDHYLYKEAS